MSTPAPDTQAPGEEGAWGHRGWQRQTDLAYSCLGLLGLCASASLSPLPEWPAGTQPSIAGLQAGQRWADTRPLVNAGAAAGAEAVSTERGIDFPFPVSRCCSFTSKDYAALSTFC